MIGIKKNNETQRIFQWGKGRKHLFKRIKTIKISYITKNKYFIKIIQFY